ncbi:hypothetical protein OH76DRAFT_1348589 [Lentinus brumalis]|uniref:2OGFeDO JBP1/TET oxygenase domain-containing protein n=1 Tax=Lentinus brumalis TaxID=2498619 RepID=A0A371DDH5_9APHY|nr:hypothetical protein OH76DRAFT_1348589 [Polyporus brumalis]
MLQQGPDASPVASEVLRGEEGASWMRALQVCGGLTDGILAVTHPAQYRAGFDAQIKMSMRASELRPYISQWPFAYTAVQVMVNRLTIHHRDKTGRPGWFDLLLSFGTYGDTAVVAFRNLGASVPYGTGSAVMVNSRVVIHAVPEVPPDRICYAFFMSDVAHEWLGIEDPGWSKVGDRRRGE